MRIVQRPCQCCWINKLDRLAQKGSLVTEIQQPQTYRTCGTRTIRGTVCIYLSPHNGAHLHFSCSIDSLEMVQPSFGKTCQCGPSASQEFGLIFCHGLSCHLIIAFVPKQDDKALSTDSLTGRYQRLGCHANNVIFIHFEWHLGHVCLIDWWIDLGSVAFFTPSLTDLMEAGSVLGQWDGRDDSNNLARNFGCQLLHYSQCHFVRHSFSLLVIISSDLMSCLRICPSFSDITAVKQHINNAHTALLRHKGEASTFSSNQGIMFTPNATSWCFRNWTKGLFGTNHLNMVMKPDHKSICHFMAAVCFQNVVSRHLG